MHPARPHQTLDQHYAQIATPEALKFSSEAALKAWESRDRAHQDLHAKMVAAKTSLQANVYPNISQRSGVAQTDPSWHSDSSKAVSAAREAANMLHDHGGPRHGPFSRLGSAVRTHLDLAGRPGFRQYADAHMQKAIDAHQQYRHQEERAQGRADRSSNAVQAKYEAARAEKASSTANTALATRIGATLQGMAEAQTWPPRAARTLDEHYAEILGRLKLETE